MTHDITAHPRQLSLMPAADQAQLDDYMATIVGYRKSGLSLNHIIGCPLDCGYCVRHFWGNFDVKTPQLLTSTDEAVRMLVGHHAFQPHVTPLQLLNKATDPFLPGVKPHLFEVLRTLDHAGYTNHVLIITRFSVTSADMTALDELRHLKVTLLLTYSGITDDRIEPIARSRITTRSIHIAATHPRRRTKVILYWRPIVPGWNDSPATMAHVLDVGRYADALVFTGLYHKKENATYLTDLGVTLPYGAGEYHRRKTMAADLDTRVVAAWRASGISTPLFRKTSCGVTYAHDDPDYNGHWGVRELCDICPAAQRHRCATAHRQPTDQDVRNVLDQFGYQSQFTVDDGHVWTHGLGEQRRYALQHTLRYQIWEIDQPHALHAHGRSLTGNQLPPDQQQDFVRIRDTFTQQVVTTDD
ncbi:hypothetical protein [Catenuloplanes japonicus]|uniref:hypothetical protein n=1 Tax=Catenuloplanes japonicus TaxID=33876 RepID=UPI000525E835|nr:hypothetical protein [Catenuloplanes japonicus]